MSIGRWSALALIVAFATTLGFAIWQDLEASRLSETLAVSLRREAMLVSEIGQLDSRVERLDAGRARWRRRGPVRSAGADIGVPTNAPSRPITAAVEARAVRTIRANLDLRYRLFLTKLGLSSDQIERWETGMVEYSQRMGDIAAAAADQDLPATDPGIVALRQAEVEQWKNQEAELLGANADAQLQQFNRVAPAAAIASELAGRVFGSDTPLTAVQGNQLTQILANASTKYQQGGGASANSIDWNAVIAQAQGVLSAGQLETLQAISADHQVRYQLQQRVAKLLKQP